jgi:hypothetical protein
MRCVKWWPQHVSSIGIMRNVVNAQMKWLDAHLTDTSCLAEDDLIYNKICVRMRPKTSRLTNEPAKLHVPYITHFVLYHCSSVRGYVEDICRSFIISVSRGYLLPKFRE